MAKAKAKKPAKMGENEWNTERIYLLAAAMIVQYGLEKNVEQFHVHYEIRSRTGEFPNVHKNYTIWVATDIKKPNWTEENQYTYCFSAESTNPAKMILLLKKKILKYRNASSTI